MRRLARALVAAASAVLLVASFSAHPFASWAAAAAAALFPVALVAAVGLEGAVDRRRRRRLALVLALLLVLLEGGLLGLLALAGRPTVWVGPLPLGAVLQWLVLGLAPLPVVALGYALTFERGPSGERAERTGG